ncbi:hypothetical protein KJ782_03030 [Patescibacteria group bacterium]|nr:hypothetical protein [Patescibacteria group bacterium]
MFKEWKIVVERGAGLLYRRTSHDDFVGYPVVGDRLKLKLRIQHGGEIRVRCCILDVDQRSWDRTVFVAVVA